MSDSFEPRAKRLPPVKQVSHLDPTSARPTKPLVTAAEEVRPPNSGATWLLPALLIGVGGIGLMMVAVFVGAYWLFSSRVKEVKRQIAEIPQVRQRDSQPRPPINVSNSPRLTPPPQTIPEPPAAQLVTPVNPMPASIPSIEVTPPPVLVAQNPALVPSPPAETAVDPSLDATKEAAVTPAVDNASSRRKVPSDEALKKAKADLREILKADYEDAQKPAGKLTLATKLQRLAKDTPDDPTMRYALLSDAYQYALEASQAALVFSLSEELAADYDVDVWELKGEAIKTLSPMARSSAERQQVAEAAFKIAEEAAAGGNYALADQMLKIASTRVVDPKLKATINVRAREIDDLEKQVKFAKLAEERLQTDPENPAANIAWGKYLCFFRGEWEQGLPHLAKGNDAALKTAATEDMKAPTKAEEQIAIGDLWWDAAEATKTSDKHGMLSRSGFWYGQALDETSGITKVRLDKRLAEIKESVPTSTVAGSPARSKSINIIALIDPAADAIKGEWSIERGALVCSTQHFVPKLYLPYLPPEEYDIKIVFSQPKIRHDIGVILPRDGNSFSWQAGGEEGKFLFSVQPPPGGRNPTESRFPGAVMAGRQYTTVVQVRNAGVVAFFEGKQMAAYKTDYRDMRVSSWHTLPDATRMAVCCDDPTIFHVIEVTEVTGTGKLLRAAK